MPVKLNQAVNNKIDTDNINKDSLRLRSKVKLNHPSVIVLQLRIETVYESDYATIASRLIFERYEIDILNISSI